MVSDFEEMVEAVVEDGLTESAVVSHYFLVNYPYLQGQDYNYPEGDLARFELLRKFRQPGRLHEKESGNQEM